MLIFYLLKHSESFLKIFYKKQVQKKAISYNFLKFIWVKYMTYIEKLREKKRTIEKEKKLFKGFSECGL